MKINKFPASKENRFWGYKNNHFFEYQCILEIIPATYSNTFTNNSDIYLRFVRKLFYASNTFMLALIISIHSASCSLVITKGGANRMIFV